MRNSKIACVLFDLDGTLVDTAPDLVAALNHLLTEDGRECIPYASARPYASAGSRGLLKLGFAIEETDPGYAELRRRFLDFYANNLHHHSRPFDGIEQALTALQSLGLNWGVVTNKPGFLTDPLMAALEFPSAPLCIVGGDATPRLKPHPDNLLLACQQIGHAPENCLYVGDAERDIIAGRRAGMRTVAVSYGYIENGHAPAEWGADALIDHPGELIQHLQHPEQ